MATPNSKHEATDAPLRYKGVMVSSTFTDLTEHRNALIRAIDRQQMKAVVMENDSAKPDGDVVDSSLRMVHDASAYVGVISHKYGQIPDCKKRNPDRLSLTELEFNEARGLNRPILLFIMGDQHPVKRSDVEIDPEKIEKLKKFRESAKRLNANSPINRVYTDFDSLHEFEVKATQSVSELRRLLEAAGGKSISSYSDEFKIDPIPKPPALYAEPPYIGSHSFVGRQAQIDTISDWATPADSHTLLLFEAIGGTGKSILTWEWTTKFACSTRGDWAGRIWYSFYERGATMVDFCRRALAYMTGEPRGRFREKNTAELTPSLIHQLQARPWLVVLDGLERVLVSYHRFDAAQARDEEAGTVDKIAQRDPCAAINPEDEDLLRALAGAHPSKLLLTTRLIPRVLLNKTRQPIPGVLMVNLPGLRPADAESLFRACGITGTSLDMQNYLKSHCDCHPLVIGALAGIINDYLPDRGNFDAWSRDPKAGDQLNLSKLDLVQKRNHILNSALAALPEKSRQLLATLALLSGSVDFPTLSALNPHLTPIPEAVDQPEDPTLDESWERISAKAKTKALEEFRHQLERRKTYEQALLKRKAELSIASEELTNTVRDLERRGLLQYDAVSKRHDIHPVVRAIAVGGLKQEEKSHLGQRVVDHFSQRAENPYEETTSIKDFDHARQVVEALLQMGKFEQAVNFILGNRFISYLGTKFEAHNEIVAILRPFFSEGWGQLPQCLQKAGATYFAKRAAVALRRIGALRESFLVSELGLQKALGGSSVNSLFTQLLNIASTAGEQNRTALERRLLNMASAAVSIYERKTELIAYQLANFRYLAKIGSWAEASAQWSHMLSNELLPQERGIAAHHNALFLFFCGKLTEEYLAEAEKLVQASSAALGIRNLYALRGFWQLENQKWEGARKSLQEAVALAHKAGKRDLRSEIRLALAKYQLGQLPDPPQSAEAFSLDIEGSCHRALAELWLAIGDSEKASIQAIAAYKWASSDGEPYVHRYELTKAGELLKKLQFQIPAVVPFDPKNEVHLEWERNVSLKIEELRIAAAEEKITGITPDKLKSSKRNHRRF